MLKEGLFGKISLDFPRNTNPLSNKTEADNKHFSQESRNKKKNENENENENENKRNQKRKKKK